MQAPAFLSGTYDETMALLIEARAYAATNPGMNQRQAEPLDRFRITCEAMRVTTRLAEVMAWVMFRRAAHEGEISREDALSEDCRLSCGRICGDESFTDDPALPKRLRGLLDRSRNLYIRVTRLDAMLDDAPTRSRHSM